MKRLVLRLMVLAAVVGVGALAVVQAQRSSEKSADPSKAKPGAIAPATDANLPPSLASKAPLAPLPTTVYRANEIPTADRAFGYNGTPGKVVLAAATEPVPGAANSPSANASGPVDLFSRPLPLPPTSGPTLAAAPIAARPIGNADDPAGATVNPLRRDAPTGQNPMRSEGVSLGDPASKTALSYPSDKPATSLASTNAAAPAKTESAEPRPLRLDPTPPSPLAPAGGVKPLNGATRAEPTGMEGIGQPGKKHLEGPQMPQVTIQKFAPDAIQVGKPALFKVAVINTGQAPAQGVEIRDQVPKGTQLMSTKPKASRGASGELVWELGTLKPGDETSVEMQVMPVAEGEIGSTASVRFNADASARTVATKPELVIKSTAPSKILIGEEVALSITVSNPGSGVANNVVLLEKVPAGLQHPAGAELEYQVGTLKPGEQRQLQLSLSSVRAGVVTNVLLAHGEGNLRTEDRREIEVIAPQIDLSMEGPKRRFLEREATYTMAVSNTGTAPAKQVELTAYLPRGLKFVSANNAGQYDASTGTVRWLLAELPANDADKVELVTLPIEPGEQRLRLEGKAERGAPVEKEQPIVVEGIAAIKFEVIGVNNPIEKGGETTYEIRVANQGSKAATNVRVIAMLPPGLKALAAEGPSRNSLDAAKVQFDALPQLAAKADTIYRIRAQGLRAGDQRIRVQLTTDELQEPVTKEESTRVYADE